MMLLTATVTPERLLQLPHDVQAQLKPGQQIQLQFDPTQLDAAVTGLLPTSFAPNENGLAALREIARRQEGRHHTDGSQTDQMLRDARAGAMYGDPD